MPRNVRQKPSWNLPEIDTLAGLEECRTWLTNIMLLFIVIAFPIAMLFSGSIFFQEKMYFLIALDAIIYFVISIVFFLKKESMPIVAYIWLLLLYTILITFFAVHGPHYAWSAWLVMAAVMAAFFFGLRGAIFATILNVLILMALYFSIDATNSAWANVFTEPFRNWVMFVVNVSLVTIISAFPVGFLLKRIDTSLNREKNATENLSEKMVELKRNNGEVKKHTENLKAILDSAPNVLALVDEEIRVEMINRKGAALVGRDKEILSGALCGDIFNCRHAFNDMGYVTKPECLDCPLRTHILSTFETGKPHTEEEGQVTFSLNGKETTMDILISTCLLRLNGSKKVLLSLADLTFRLFKY